MKKTIAITCFIFAAVCLQAQTLSWDIKFLKGKPRESVSISQIIKMETGEDFLLTITPALDCFCYMVLYDSERQISVLYNEPMKAENEIMFGPFKVEAPSGTDTLYVIMSMSKQTKLESLIQYHKENPDSRQHSNNLYREVVNLQNTASGLGESAGVFIASGGTSRGSTQVYVNRFSEKNMYVKTITIRH